MELVVRDLGVARGGVPVLDGVGFALAPGRALVLRGPNGVGKTTLLRTVAGLQPALAGTISGGGERIALFLQTPLRAPSIRDSGALSIECREHPREVRFEIVERAHG